MSTATKTITASKPKAKRNWQAILTFAFGKLSENILDMVVTIASVSITLAVSWQIAPEATAQYSGFIIAAYLLILFRRITQDFDDAYTLDELGERVDLLIDLAKASHRIQRNEDLDPEEESDLQRRMQSIM
jgi:hypothetical protein